MTGTQGTRNEDLVASASRYRDFVHLSSEGIWRFECAEPIPLHLPVEEKLKLFLERARLAEVNQAMLRTLGYASESEVLGQNLRCFLRPFNERVAGLRDLFRSNSPTNQAVIQHECPDGRVLWLERRMTALVEDCQLHGVWCTMRDITRKQLLENIVASLSRSVSAASGTAYLEGLTFQLANSFGCEIAAICETLVAADGELLLRPVVCSENGEVSRPPTRPIKGLAAERVLLGGRAVWSHNLLEEFPDDWILRKKGMRGLAGTRLVDSKGVATGIFALISKRPLADPQLALDALEAFAARASAEMERVRCERTIEEAQLRREAFLRLTPNGIFSIGMREPVSLDLEAAELARRIEMDGRIEDCNPAMVELAGLSEAPIGMACHLLKFPWSGPEGWVQRINSTGFPVKGVPYRRQVSNRTLELECSLSAQVTDGRLERIFGLVWDVTAKNEMERQIRELSAHRAAVLERERARVAHDVHDQIGQVMSGMKFQLAAMTGQLGEGHEGLREDIAELNNHVSQAIEWTRRFADDFRPPILDYFGLGAAIEWHAGMFEKTTGVRCRAVLAEGLTVAGNLATAIYRIVQESLVRLVERGAAAIGIRLEAGAECLLLRIEEHERRVEATEVGEHGFGLIVLRELAVEAGGKLEVLESAGKRIFESRFRLAD